MSESYHRAFLDSLTQKAIFTDSLQARLNLTSLIDHRDNGTPRDIFDPLIGWELRTEWVEQYLEALPPLPPRAEPGYTLYLMNLSAFDDPLAGVDHWFVEPTPDPDTLQDQDWWRLEWDNDLNTPMGYPLNIWGGPAYQVFVDPTAYQWYQDWFYLWFQGGNERAPFGLQYEEVPVASRLDYLAGVVNDLIEGLAATLPSAPPQERGMEIRTFVLSGSLDHSLDDLRWIVSDLALESYLEGFLPFKEWEMNTTVALVADYPELRAVVDSHTTFDGNWGFIDGAAIFDYLNQNRELYVPDDPEVFEVLTMNFLYNNRSMVFSDREFTGLGGDGITVIFLKTDRLFYADGTRQKGLTSLIAHETGHNLGYGHQFGPNWRADFVNGNMGYFRNDLEYGRFWEDALHRVYVREKLLILLALLDGREPLDLAPEFPSFYQHYKELDLLTAYSDLVEIEGMLTDSVPPAAEAGPSLTVEEDTSILLNGGASTDNFRIHTYSWDFGDGTTFSASEPTVVKIWNDPGVYPVTLTVYDAAGNQDTDVLFATVLDITPPVISILSPSSGTLLATSEVEVTWAAVDEGLGLDRIEVRLDAGAPAVVTPPVSSHTFMAVADGHHLLTVTAIDEARNRASVSASFRVETAGSAFVAPSVTWSLVAAAVTASVGVGYVLYRRYIRRRAPGERPRTPPE